MLIPTPNGFRSILFFTVVAFIVGFVLPTSTLAQPLAQTPPSDICTDPANPVVAENCLPGTPDWYVANPFYDIEGFASAASANPGETLTFYVHTDAPVYDLRIYRTGYYGGNGGRLVAEFPDLPGQQQPECLQQHDMGLASCRNWQPSYQLTIPEEWVSGIYLAKLVRPDSGGENLIHFVVRDDERDADILLQQSVTTYQAYNNYGDKSLYSSIVSNSCLTVADAPRAVKVSFDRPNNVYPYGHNSYAWSDFPLVYWLEAQGYDVVYTTNLDTHYAGQTGAKNELLDHRLFLSLGHDEYWSAEMRQAVTAARDAGVHLAFFSSNVSYWRIRLEPDPWDETADRVEVTYKTTESGPADPEEPTTTWRDVQGANHPEAGLVGIQYVGDNDSFYFPLRVTAVLAQDPIYRHTDLPAMPPDSYVDIGQRLVGWEWDALANNGEAASASGTTPEDLTILAETPVYGNLLLDDGRTYGLGQTMAHVARYTAVSGGQVFATGTNQWGWGLALFEPDTRIQQITYNVLADMGVQPTTPAHTLTLDEGVTATAVPHVYGADAPVSGTTAVTGVLDVLAAEGDNVAERPVTVTEPRLSNQGSPPALSDIEMLTTDHSAIIRWRTDQPTNGQAWVKIAPGPMDFRLSAALGWRLPVAANSLHTGLRQNHQLAIWGLDPDTTYYVQIASRNENGHVTISEELPLQTAGSLMGSVKLLARTAVRSLPCGLRANGVFLAVGIGVVLVLGTAVVVVRRRRKVKEGD